MRLKTQTVVTKLDFWAVPRNKWDITQEDPDTHKVVAMIQGGKPWQDEAVLVHTHEVRTEVFAMDLTAPTVEALQEAINLEKQAAMDRIIKLETRLQEVLALPQGE